MGAEDIGSNTGNASIQTEPLSLRALDDQIMRCMLRDTTNPAKESQTTGWIMFIGGAVITFISALALPASWASATALCGLAIEVSGGAYLAFLELRTMKLGRLRQEFASELDSEHAGQLSIVNWLRHYDARELSDKLRFVRARMASMTRKLGILLGSVEKLGALPVVVAIYLQFRGIKLAWSLEINLTEFLLGLLIMCFYAAGMLGIALRLRLHVYEVLLEEALHEPKSVVPPLSDVKTHG